jgi:alpha-1,2-mannosyltransferase
VRSARTSIPVLVAQLALPVLAALIVVPFVKPGGVLWPWAPSTVDLDVYQFAGRVVLEGGDILTARAPLDAAGGRLAFIYPPFAALLCIPLVVVPHTLLQILMTSANALAVLAVLHRVGLKGWTLSLTGLGCVLLVEPVRETIGFGQVNILLMTLIVLDLVPGPRLLRGKPWLPRGALSGIASAIKVTPALFGVYLLLARRWRAALGLIISAGVLTLGTALLMPRETIGFFRLLLEGDTRTGPTYFLFNQSIVAAMLRVFGDQPTSYHVGIAISAVVALVGAYAAALWHRRGHVLLAVSLCGTATLMASPLSWTHHFVWVVPLGAALILGKDLPKAIRIVGLTFAIWIGSGLYKEMPWGVTQAGQVIELSYNGIQQAISVAGPVFGVALLLVAVVEAHRTRATAGEAQPESASVA